jgi:hypothetical protein
MTRREPGVRCGSRERVALELATRVAEHPLPAGLSFEELVDTYLSDRDRRPR